MLRSFRDLARLVHAARVLAQHDALFPREIARALPPQLKLARAVLGGNRRTNDPLPPGMRLAAALESLGPAYIKLGQLLATRPDIIGDETARALAALQDRLPAFPTAAAKAEVEAAFGAPLPFLFADFGVLAVDWQRTAARVLTSEWVAGTQVRTAAELEAAGHDAKRIAVLIVRQFLTQALRDGFFHADMHQGNLFVDSEGRLVCVDFGIMGRLAPAMRRFLAETLAGFLARDYERVATVHYEAGFVPRSHPVPLFAQALRAIGE